MSSLKRIVIHHTAGNYKASSYDKHFYHYLIEGSGQIIKGDFNPQDNIDCKDNCYAPHIRGFNTGSIGVACCGNYNYSLENRCYSSHYPLTQVQMESMYSCIANLCLTFDIPVTLDTVFTHYEYDSLHLKEGKVDITFIPYCPNIPVNKVGDYIRQKILWYINKYERIRNEKTKKSFKKV